MNYCSEVLSLSVTKQTTQAESKSSFKLSGKAHAQRSEQGKCCKTGTGCARTGERNVIVDRAAQIESSLKSHFSPTTLAKGWTLSLEG